MAMNRCRYGMPSRGAAMVTVATCGFGAIAAITAPTAARDGSGPLLYQQRMSEPLRGLTADELARFQAGKSLYFTPIPLADGLGPIFNKAACFGCHGTPIGGSGMFTVTRFGHDDGITFDPLTELGGPLLQSRANDDACLEEIPAEANVIAERAVNGSFGYGLVEAIPDADLIALEQDPPGISGRAHMVDTLEDPGVLRVGRFGWKAQIATILSFSADAALNEMGLTNRFLQVENDPNGIREPNIEDCDTTADPEDGPDGDGLDFIDRVTDFQRLLAAPPQTPQTGMTGETLFNAVGCADCHHPSFTTADDAKLEAALRNRAIRPYSNFLLHDMGEAGDGIAQGDAGTTEIRTAPLWGLRRRPVLWHDGRFDQPVFEDRARAAVEAHGAAGAESIDVHAAWAALSSDDQDRVIAFLGSLGRLEFDHEGDGAVTLQDFVYFFGCYTGPGKQYTPDDACAVHDIDQDGDVDDDDYASFGLAYQGALDDCNDNGTPDIEDIFEGTSDDENGNGVPDECEECPGDHNKDGMIGFADVLETLSEWGACPGVGPCPWDLSGDRIVGFADILILLASWGPC